MTVAAAVLLASIVATDPPSLLPAIREADRIVAKCDIPADAFAAMTTNDAAKNEAHKKASARLDACLATLAITPLRTTPGWLSVSVITAAADSEGEMRIEAKIDAQRNGACTKKDEGRRLGEMKKQRDEIISQHDREKAARLNSGKDWRSTDVERHDQHLKNFDENAAPEIEKIQSAIASRRKAFNAIAFSLAVDPALAPSLDVPGLLNAKSVKLVIAVSSVELSAPQPDALMPAAITKIGGRVIAVR